MRIFSLTTILLLALMFSLMLVVSHFYLLQEADQEREKEKLLWKEVAGGATHKIAFSTSQTTLINSQQQRRKTSFPALDCPTFFPAAKAGQLGFNDTNQGMDPDSYIRLTADVPKFKIALHNKGFDPVRWCIMDYGRYYERALVKIWRDVLLADASASSSSNHNNSNDTETIVLDVGGNIGFFSLLSLAVSEETKQRIRVHTFEPNPLNNVRLCESLQLNDWHHPPTRTHTGTTASTGEEQNVLVNNQKAFIEIHPIGVAQQNGVMSFILPSSNPGAGYFAKSSDLVPSDVNATKIMVFTLDDFARRHGWLDYDAAASSSSSSRRASSPNIAILKIDVEKLEPEVVLGAKELIASRLVRNIFMEVTVKTDEQWKACAQALEVIVHAGYHLAGEGGFMGPNMKSMWPNDEHLVTNILTAAKKQRSKQLNLWWVVAPVVLPQ
jgi:hypothetical protein